MSVCREPDSGRAEETEEQAAEEGDSGGETKGEAETRGAAATAAAATTEQDKESGSGPGGTEGRGTQSRQTRQGMCPPPLTSESSLQQKFIFLFIRYVHSFQEFIWVCGFQTSLDCHPLLIIVAFPRTTE